MSRDINLQGEPIRLWVLLRQEGTLEHAEGHTTPAVTATIGSRSLPFDCNLTTYTERIKLNISTLPPRKDFCQLQHKKGRGILYLPPLPGGSATADSPAFPAGPGRCLTLRPPAPTPTNRREAAARPPRPAVPQQPAPGTAGAPGQPRGTAPRESGGRARP